MPAPLKRQVREGTTTDGNHKRTKTNDNTIEGTEGFEGGAFKSKVLQACGEIIAFDETMSLMWLAECLEIIFKCIDPEIYILDSLIEISTSQFPGHRLAQLMIFADHWKIPKVKRCITMYLRHHAHAITADSISDPQDVLGVLFASIFGGDTTVFLHLTRTLLFSVKRFPELVLHGSAEVRRVLISVLRKLHDRRQDIKLQFIGKTVLLAQKYHVVDEILSLSVQLNKNELSLEEYIEATTDRLQLEAKDDIHEKLSWQLSRQINNPAYGLCLRCHVLGDIHIPHIDRNKVSCVCFTALRKSTTSLCIDDQDLGCRASTTVDGKNDACEMTDARFEVVDGDIGYILMPDGEDILFSRHAMLTNSKYYSHLCHFKEIQAEGGRTQDRFVIDLSDGRYRYEICAMFVKIIHHNFTSLSDIKVDMASGEKIGSLMMASRYLLAEKVTRAINTFLHRESESLTAGSVQSPDDLLGMLVAIEIGQDKAAQWAVISRLLYVTQSACTIETAYDRLNYNRFEDLGDENLTSIQALIRELQTVQRDLQKRIRSTIGLFAILYDVDWNEVICDDNGDNSIQDMIRIGSKKLREKNSGIRLEDPLYVMHEELSKSPDEILRISAGTAIVKKRAVDTLTAYSSSTSHFLDGLEAQLILGISAKDQSLLGISAKDRIAALSKHCCTRHL